MSDLDIPLARPDLSDLEQRLVLEVLESGRLSMGPMQEEFERLVADRAGCGHGVAVSSGTCGLHLVLLALGIGPGDEVITTPFSFIASSNAILYVGAKPVFVDICPKTLNMDPQKIEGAITDRTRAILAVETFGNPSYMDQYAAIAQRHEIPMIEDCCEALGTTLKGRPAGSFGRAGVFGFYANKQITTGEGGMIVTDDEHLASVCRSLRNQGRPLGTGARAQAGKSWLRHDRLGYNYRLSELHAALGVAQMRRLDELIELRQEVAAAYMTRLLSNPEIALPHTDPQSFMSWFVFVVRLQTHYSADERARVLQGMRNHEVGVSDYFPCIHLQPFYRDRFGYAPGSFPIAESVSGRTIALPFHPRLTVREVDIVAQTLELMMSRLGLSRE